MNRLSRVFVPVGALALLFSEVLLIAACFLSMTFLILNVDPMVFLLSDNGLLRIAVAVASILFGLYFEDLYTHIYVKSRVLLVQQLALVMGIALVIQGLVSYINDGFRLPLRLMVPACAALVVALFTWRVMYSLFVLQVVGPQRILFAGMCPLHGEMAAHIAAHPELGLQVIGFLEDGSAGAPPDTGRRLGSLDDLQKVVNECRPDRLVVGFAERRGRMPVAELLQLRYGGLPIDEVATAYEQLCGRVVLSELHPSELLLSRAFRPRPERLVFQTIVHWLAAFALAVVSAPLLVLAALLLKLSSRGPLLLRQPSIGLGGRPFALYSFRLAGDGPEKWNGVQRLVARWRLHLLPHLWNVLRGEICFVGPRADRPEFAAALHEQIPFYLHRCRVKPGLTGWAQINMPKDQPEDTLQRLAYDFYYLRNFSRALDAYILVHTLRDVLLARTG